MNAILQAARSGEADAFAELWSAFNPRLLRYLAVREPARSEDVASETWLHVVRDLSRFRGDIDDFRAWLFALARHRSVDAARAAQRHPCPVADPPEQSVGDVTEIAVLGRLAAEEAVRWVRQLPADQADVVALRFIADLDVFSTAALLGKSTGAVRVACHRGLKTLAAMAAVTTEEHR